MDYLVVIGIAAVMAVICIAACISPRGGARKPSDPASRRDTNGGPVWWGNHDGTPPDDGGSSFDGGGDFGGGGDGGF